MKTLPSATIIVLIITTLILSIIFDRKPLPDTPKAFPHFTDNGDGTITDNWSKLIWLKNADCIGEKTWDQAVSFSQSLTDEMCGLNDNSLPGDWRLPNQKELQSLLDPGNYSPVFPHNHPFIGIKNGCYWIESTAKDSMYSFNHMYLGDGGVGLGGIFVCSNRLNRKPASKFLMLPVRFGNNEKR